jgi:hypothetical protein
MSAPSEYPLYENPLSNVVWGPRCGEFWPDPTPSPSGEGDGVPVTYVSVSQTGVLDLYICSYKSQRWKHAASTTKEKLLDEYRRREGR